MYYCVTASLLTSEIINLSWYPQPKDMSDPIPLSMNEHGCYPTCICVCETTPHKAILKMLDRLAVWEWIKRGRRAVDTMYGVKLEEI